MNSRWSLDFTVEAEGDLAKLDRPLRRRIVEKVEWLGENFDSVIPVPLNAEFKDFYKLRVGDWRVVYRVKWNSRLIEVCYIDRRDKIYKRLKR